jgi:hypothetical protein
MLVETRDGHDYHLGVPSRDEHDGCESPRHNRPKPRIKKPCPPNLPHADNLIGYGGALVHKKHITIKSPTEVTWHIEPLKYGFRRRLDPTDKDYME